MALQRAIEERNKTNAKAKFDTYLIHEHVRESGQRGPVEVEKRKRTASEVWCRRCHSEKKVCTERDFTTLQA